jgi:hypothetical protein
MNSRSSRFARSVNAAVKGRGRSLVVLGVFFLGLSLSAFSQEATIVGTVTDPSGSVVPNVKIRITHVETGEVRSIVTTESGQYAAADLPIGHYNLNAQAPGFKIAEHKDVVLNVADHARVDFQMQLGSTTETVTVEANMVRVQSDSGEISDVINGQQITQLATNGRSVFELEALTPGASSIQSDFQVPTSAGGDFNVSFNGQRVSHNLWLIDGGEAADRGGGGGADVLPSMDAIAEFRTMTSNYSAEYGLSSAGTMTMVIKSGTKQLHATAFYFGRNDAFDARNYFNPAPNPVAELRFNDWGFNVGGPVAFRKSTNPKTFFFYNMEWRRYIQGGLFNVTVPLASMYPDASGAGTGAVIPTTLANGSTLNMVVPTGVVGLGANCPGGKPPAGIVPGQPFPNNTIPDCMIDANAAALLQAGIFNQPTSGWQFIGGNKQPTTGKEEIARIDHQFSDKFSVFGHWISDQAIQTYGTTQWSSDNVPTVFDTFGNPSYSAVVHTTYVISPTLLNEVAFNYDGNRIHILPQGIYTAPSGFTEGANRIFNGPNADNRIPDIHLAGSTGSFYTANWTPWNNTANDYQIRDDLSWTKGAHQLKFGFSWAFYKKAQDYFAETQGGFGFNGSFTSPAGCTTSTGVTCGLDYADFLLGYAQSYNENAIKSTGYWNNISPAAYVQDNWRATHRLTLNLGLRWDGIPHTYEAYNHMSNFYPNLYNFADRPVFANAADTQIAANSPGLGTSTVAELQGYQFYLNGMGMEGQNGIPKGLVNNTWDAFGPRLGFAYDLLGSGNTIIRGGFGIMYERIQGNDMYNAATNPPWGYGLNVNNVTFSNPHDSAAGGAITVPIVPASVTGLSQFYPVPTTYQYSAGVQQGIGRNAVFSVSYVGNQGRHESYLQEINLPPQADLACLQSSINCTGAQPAFNGLVTYPGYNSLKIAYDGANAHYNSLQTELRGRLTKDLTLQAAYTLSRSIDPSTGDNSGSNGWDLDQVSNPYAGWRYDLGPSVLDRTNIAFVNFVYDIPVFRNSPNRLLKTTVGGWELSGIVTAESGPPLNLSLSGQNVASIFPGGDVMNRPNLSGGVSYPHTAAQWFNPSGFSNPAAGTWGNLGFDGVRGPGRDNWNLSIFKSFVISENRGSRFELRFESFNTWNHTQFGASGTNGGISTAFGSSNFGAVTNAYDPRVFQFGGKIIY